MMDRTLEEIITLPIEFRGQGDISMYDLLQRSGYEGTRETVTERRIQECLAKHPECVDAWLAYSEDQRCLGWYFTKEPDSENYRVGCLGEGSHQPRRTFGNRVEACAYYIKREIEKIGGHE